MSHKVKYSKWIKHFNMKKAVKVLGDNIVKLLEMLLSQ